MKIMIVTTMIKRWQTTGDTYRSMESAVSADS